ncbi:hypothetical protein DOFOFD_08105 [Acetobacteraceae bacterium EV16P]|uniref:Uncharacterized protein n=1 Tax=Sorlinia euscelidii TaxID=3081148 RepID=A0ABU7U298_9PROT
MREAIPIEKTRHIRHRLTGENQRGGAEETGGRAAINGGQVPMQALPLAQDVPNNRGDCAPVTATNKASVSEELVGCGVSRAAWMIFDRAEEINGRR